MAVKLVDKVNLLKLPAMKAGEEPPPGKLRCLAEQIESKGKI
jgi:hypothetical protein